MHTTEFMIPERYNIGNFKVSIVNIDNIEPIIFEALNSGNHGYICVSNARSAYQSNHEPDYCRIQNESFLTVPDGRPLSWIAHNMGYDAVGQVSGYDLFQKLISKSKERGYSHYFYGSTPDSIEKMAARFKHENPEVELKGAVSPPFQPIENFDIKGLADEINKCAPTFFWVGLGAPKQERLMAKLQPLLKSTICIGVGLVFEYYAGNVKRAPAWSRKLGLEWLIRSLQQPKQSWKRNFSKPFFWTLKQIALSKRYK